MPYLRSCEDTGRDLLVLGDPLELGSRSARARSAWVAVPGPGLPLVGLAAVSARHRAAVAELATSWPDSEMLDRVGRAHWTTSGAGAGPNALHPARSAATRGSATSATPRLSA